MKLQKTSLLGIFVLLAAFLLLLSSCDNKIEDPAIYNVYFISDNSVYHSQSVAEGSYISQPATPARQGYEFTGWYIDSGCVTPFDFSNPVSSELYLYAGWKLENPDDKPAYTVSFILNGGSGVSNVIVFQGQKLYIPATPTKEGYIFTGWYTDSSLSSLYNFENAVYSNFSLYAGWAPVGTSGEYIVSFISNGGTPILSQNIISGGNVTKPEDPIRANYIFAGWYEDQALTMPYDFSSPVTHDIVLYAKWIQDGIYTVTFHSEYGYVPTAQNVLHGEKAKEPGKITKKGSIFSGWYLEDRITRFDFDSPVEQNLELYAVWEEPVEQLPSGSTPAKYFNWYQNDDGTLTISSLNDDGANLTDIYTPSYLNGKRVSKIDESAFYVNNKIRSFVTDANEICSYVFRSGNIETVVLNDGVTLIHDYAFSGCENLTTINIPDSVTGIGERAFSGCTNLKEITIPASVETFNSAFSGSGIETVILEEGITDIPQFAFSGCENLTTVIIPESMTIIGEYAFYGCTNLTTINIPDSVTSIGEYAFYGCTNLKEITIPASVETFGSAFSGSGIETVNSGLCILWMCKSDDN